MSRKKDVDLDLTGFAELFMNDEGRAESRLPRIYEYAVREDILMAMKELNLPDDQAMALLKQRGPLDDVFKDFSKLETDYMETVRGAIESFAERKAAKDRNWEAR